MGNDETETGFVEPVPVPEKTFDRITIADPTDAVEIGQKEAVVGKGVVLKSYGSLTCVMLALDDMTEGLELGALAHLDGATNVKVALEDILAEMKKHGSSDMQKIRARVVGGMPGQSEQLVRDIYAALNAQHIAIAGKDVLSATWLQPASLALDTRTHTLFDIPLPSDADRAAKSNQTAWQERIAATMIVPGVVMRPTVIAS